MAELKITLAQVSECAGQIRSCNQQMFEDLNQTKKVTFGDH